MSSHINKQGYGEDEGMVLHRVLWEGKNNGNVFSYHTEYKSIKTTSHIY